jgi:hypothetical protein
VTDNRPLTRILYQYAKLPPRPAGQLLRYTTSLSAFHCSLQRKASIRLMPIVFQESQLFRRNLLVTWQSTMNSMNICSFVHQCNTFTFYFLLFVDMFRPHTAIFKGYSILPRNWCSVMPIFACHCASHVLLLMVCLLSVSVC